MKRFDEDGNVTGERRFLGLYTHTAYRASPTEIPILRRKVAAVLERAGFLGSHNEKALIEILDTYPRDELFQISGDELFEAAMGILHLGERQRPVAPRPVRALFSLLGSSRATASTRRTAAASRRSCATRRARRASTTPPAYPSRCRGSTSRRTWNRVRCRTSTSARWR